jgi:glycosyltransferase involved in cell wall biosynthesis
VWIVGAAALSDKAEFEARLRARAARADLSGAVDFTGYRSDVVALMKGMDVVVQASVAHESLSMVLLEALMLGRRVVASRVGGTEEAVRDGVTGLVVEPGNPGALAGAILRALEPGGAVMAAAGQSDARERFSTAAYLENIARVYRKTLKN